MEFKISLYVKNQALPCTLHVRVPDEYDPQETLLLAASKAAITEAYYNPDQLCPDGEIDPAECLKMILTHGTDAQIRIE